MTRHRSLFAVAVLASGAYAKSYNLLRYYGGNTFFDYFQFFGTFDQSTNSPTADFLNSGDDFMANRVRAGSSRERI